MNKWIYDNGTWSAGTDQKQIWVESTDFLHDVRLYVDGDFEDSVETLDYANEIAKRLNTAPRELSDEEILDCLEKSDLPMILLSDFATEKMKVFARAILKKASEK